MLARERPSIASIRDCDTHFISEYIAYAISHLTGGPTHTYDKLADEGVYIVDLDDGTWGVGEAYDAAYRYGNVFEEPLGAVLASPGRQRASHEA